MQHASIQGATARSSHTLTSQSSRTHSPAKHPHALTLPSLLPLHPPSPLTYPLQAFFNLKQSELTKREGILEERLEQLHRSEGKLREREESSERTNREVVTQETALRTQARQAKPSPSPSPSLTPSPIPCPPNYTEVGGGCKE